MSGRGKRPRQSWRTKMRNAAMKGTGCTFRAYEVEEAYRALIGAKPDDEVFGRVATTAGGDLLEQAEARRHRAALQDIADAEPIPNDAVAFVWCRTVAQDALSARNHTGDGGEK